MSKSNFQTADLCDLHLEKVKVLTNIQFQSFGKKQRFSGQIQTLKCFEDNSLVRKILGSNGKGKVLVVDGGGSPRCALLGDMLAELAVTMEWEGIVIYGFIRDSSAINKLDLGVKALGTIPLKSVKRDEGQLNIPVTFGGVTFRPGCFIYSDTDGIIVSDHDILR